MYSCGMGIYGKESKADRVVTRIVATFSRKLGFLK